MSIIYDALKKVEQSSVKDTKPQDLRHVHSKHKFKTYLLYLLVVCAGLFAVNTFFVFLTHSKKISGANNAGPSEVSLVKAQAKQVLAKETPPQNKANPPAQQAVLSGSPVKMSSKGLLILNGIFFSGDEGYALVNNHIVKEGDVVNGATVKRITVDEVALEVDGSILKLTITR